MLQIGNYQLASRLFVGTGKFASNAQMQAAILASGTELVTVALKRVDTHSGQDEMLRHILQPGVHLLPNTSGVRTAREAIFAAQMAREALGTDLIKIEVHPDPRYLLPDGEETLEATRVLAKEGFVVLPYVQEVGAAAVMPLGAPIGSNRGLLTRDFLRIIIEQSRIPVVVDAGIGAPSHACEAMEMGADAVLVNTAIAVADDPTSMAGAFRIAVEAGYAARQAGLGVASTEAQASSPLTAFLDELEGE